MNRTEKVIEEKDVTRKMSEKEIKRYWNMMKILAILDILCFVLLTLLIIKH